MINSTSTVATFPCSTPQYCGYSGSTPSVLRLFTIRFQVQLPRYRGYSCSTSRYSGYSGSTAQVLRLPTTPPGTALFNSPVTTQLNQDSTLPELRLLYSGSTTKVQLPGTAATNISPGTAPLNFPVMRQPTPVSAPPVLRHSPGTVATTSQLPRYCGTCTHV
ncbi:hypothetical protein DPMN_190944 [Dreissena polymorpha]|uniref:Uncharacterized protein n=1 Tax=Dreissena polymorpha TaxID=45954 RepID=A0A9D4BFA3_DREPO|nr:hypothetical protein DPMN_190944 [Dreissena polymorpha]